jgi:hypothetical protein
MVNTESTACKGSTFTKPDDGRHLFLFISWDRPKICYYCSALEKEENN